MTNASVGTEEIFIHNCCQRHFLKYFIHSIEEWILIFYVFFEFYRTFITKTHIFVDLPIFVGSSKQDDVFGVFDLEWKQKEYSLDVFVSSINVIPQK